AATTAPVEYVLDRGRMVSPRTEVVPAELPIQSPLSVGRYAGKWCSYNSPPDLPYDQREDDGGSLVFDTELSRPVELLGAPLVRLEFTASEPVAMIAARLSDVAPDGRATRISYGLLNLTHLNGHACPEPPVPGRRYQAEPQPNCLAAALPAEPRTPPALSSTSRPLPWPPPCPVRLTTACDPSPPVVPVRSVGPADSLRQRP